MKKIITILMIVMLAASIFAGGQSDTGKKTTLIFSVAAVPTDAHGAAMMKFKEYVEAKSNGSIKVETYDSGSLFKQDQELAAVKKGDADLVYLSAAWLTDGSPWIGMFNAGYMFKTYEDMTKVLNGPIGKEVFERIVKEQGIRPLGAFYLGTRQINLVKDKPVKTPADLNGVNLRMPNSEAWLFLGRALGANPTPIAFNELYLALQTGTVDGQDNPLPTNRNAKFYEVTKSITITNHLVDSVWPTINEAKWQSLNAEQKKIILEGVEAARKFCDDTNLQREKELIDFFKSQGLKIYEADLKAFSTAVLEKYLADKNQSGKWDMNLYNKVQAALK